MKSVQQHAEQLLWILLVLVIELLFKLRDYRLELGRCNWFFVVKPKLLDQLGVTDYKLTLSSEWIVVINLVFEFTRQKVIC